MDECQEFVIEALLCARYSAGWEKPTFSPEFKDLCALAGVKIGGAKAKPVKKAKKK